MNTVSTGNSIAAAIEPNDTNLVNAISISANTKQINPICQFVINSTPKDVATPFPPLNLKNTGKVFSSSEIYQKIWNEPFMNGENTVAVHIRHLREKVEINPSEPRYIKVVWGRGYKMEKCL